MRYTTRIWLDKVSHQINFFVCKFNPSAAFLLLFERLLKLKLVFGKQVCRPFVDASMPQACIETWQLCDEYLMCETERALLQLLWHLQNMPELSKISDKVLLAPCTCIR